MRLPIQSLAVRTDGVHLMDVEVFFREDNMVLIYQCSRGDCESNSAFLHSTTHGKIQDRRLTMIVTKQDLKRFHEFAVSRISDGEDELTD